MYKDENRSVEIKDENRSVEIKKPIRLRKRRGTHRNGKKNKSRKRNNAASLSSSS